MLRIISLQIESALQATDAPAGTLVEMAASMGKASQTVARCLFDFSGQPARVFQDLMVLHDDLHARADKATTAVQFHDRLVQCLTHVCSSLTDLAEFMSANRETKSTAMWNELQERIRGAHSMEQERVLFELLNRGASPDEQQAAMAGLQAPGPGKVELF